MVAYKGLLKIFLKQINLQNKVFSNTRGFSQDFFLEFQLTDNHNSPINFDTHLVQDRTGGIYKGKDFRHEPSSKTCRKFD